MKPGSGARPAFRLGPQRVEVLPASALAHTFALTGFPWAPTMCRAPPPMDSEGTELHMAASNPTRVGEGSMGVHAH